MTDRISTGKTNPRGIPEAKFIENIDEFLPKNSTEEDAGKLEAELEDRRKQYLGMEQSKESLLNSLGTKISDIEKTLETCKFLQGNEDNDEPIEVNYQLNDTVYTKAKIEPKNVKNVRLWLGANIMVEYPVDEAITMLSERLKSTRQKRQDTLDDLEFLRENITVTEVNTTRIHNWGAVRRKKN